MELDQQLFYFFHHLDGQSKITDQLIIFFGDYLIWILIFIFIATIYFNFKNAPKHTKYLPIVALTSAIIANVIISYSLKLIIHRLRPFQELPIHHLITDYTYAFPSGHTTFMIALAVGVYTYNKKFALILFILGLLIGISRIMGGVHWPSDILGGAITGFIAGYCLNKIYFTFKPKLPKIN